MLWCVELSERLCEVNGGRGSVWLGWMTVDVIARRFLQQVDVSLISTPQVRHYKRTGRCRECCCSETRRDMLKRR